METLQQSPNSSEFKPEATTATVPIGKHVSQLSPREMDTETLKRFVADSAVEIAVRSESLKPYYFELRTRLTQKEWEEFCRTTFNRTRRAIDYWLAGGNHNRPQYNHPTPDGHNNLEARSALQKEIRRCPDGTTEEAAIDKLKNEAKACNEDGIDESVLTLHEQNAMYWTNQLYDAGAAMWKKVFTVLYEDVSLAGLPVWDEIRKIEADVRNAGLRDGHGGDRNAVRAAILLLCRAKKSRVTDNVSVHLERVNPQWRPNSEADIRAAEEAAKVYREVEDYALDDHNRRGKSMGRGIDHFIEIGSKLGNPGDVREVFSPDYMRGYQKGFKDGVASVSTPPTEPEQPKPTKKTKKAKLSMSPAGQVHIDELPPEVREKIMTRIEVDHAAEQARLRADYEAAPLPEMVQSPRFPGDGPA